MDFPSFPEFHDASAAFGGLEDVTKDVSHLTFEEVEEQQAVPGLPEHACRVSNGDA